MKQLLPTTPFYKANLHTHTTITDGKLTPKETKDAYKALGYQILCLSDHNVIVDHSDMNESDFLMLTGIEVNINQPGQTALLGKSYHLNLIAKRPDILWSPSKPYQRESAIPYHDKIHFEEMPLLYDPEAINNIIKKSNEMGFLVAYNHPTWSCQTYQDYAPLKGLWAMELRNTSCIVQGYSENNTQVYKDLLNLGNRLYPLGADDMHRPTALGGSWIMVGAPQLTYDAVIDALEKGDFYMSCGPELKNLWIEDGILKITCSDAQRISLETHGRLAKNAVAEGNDWIQEAEIDLTGLIDKVKDDPSAYIHLTITAPNGTYAATRAYYLNELL